MNVQHGVTESQMLQESRTDASFGIADSNERNFFPVKQLARNGDTPPPFFDRLFGYEIQRRKR